jgi:hypothetical protein
MDAAAFLSIPPPLRPSPSDLAAYARLAAGIEGPTRMLVLGSTPDFWTLPLPTGSHRLAADRSQVMLAGLWPGGQDHALPVDWSALPLPDASHDLVLCDGGFTLLQWPDQHRQVALEAARVMRVGGLLLVRVHPKPVPTETAQEILAAFLAGRVSNSSELKLRLAAALCEEPGDGVALSQVWDAFAQAVADVENLPDACGWATEDLARMRAYAGRQDRYTFPTLDQQLDALTVGSCCFTLQEIAHPAGVPGFASPILALRRT